MSRGRRTFRQRDVTKTCAKCNAHDGSESLYTLGGQEVWLHRECARFWISAEGSR